jgi:hypothetical protein
VAVWNHSHQRQSDLISDKAFASTEARKARDRAGFGLTHRKEILNAKNAEPL